MANETASIYRCLHGAPMLGGVPAHYALALVGVASLLGFGLMSVSRVVGLSVVAGVLIVWGLLVVVYGQDRVAVPLFFLRIFHRFPRRITSYCRSYQRVEFED
jgi:hypothetical protein